MFGTAATSHEARLKPIRSVISCCIVFFVAHLTCAQTTPAKTGASPQFSGYTMQSSDPERDWEKKFQDGIVSDNVRENNRRMSARSHHVGSFSSRKKTSFSTNTEARLGYSAGAGCCAI